MWIQPRSWASQPQPLRFGARFSPEQYQELAKQTTIKRMGKGAVSKFEFQVVTDQKLETRDTLMIQELKGYHPAGYGHFRDSSTYDAAQQKWVTRWECSTSCD